MTSGLIAWPHVADRLAPARSYWLVTTGTAGSPHTAPVWGVVVADTLFLYSERRTVKARNVARDPRVAIHLPDPEDVVIVYGGLVDLGRPDSRPDVVTALDRKYAGPQDQPYLPSADPAFDVLWSLEPSSAQLWRLTDWEGSQLRWRR